jgi:hypothetical protein
VLDCEGIEASVLHTGMLQAVGLDGTFQVFILESLSAGITKVSLISDIANVDIGLKPSMFTP